MKLQNIVIKAEVGRTPNKKRKIILTIYLVVLAVSLIVGIISGTYIGHQSEKIDSFRGLSYLRPANDYVSIKWFSVPLYSYDSAHQNIDFFFGIPNMDFEEQTIWHTDLICLVALGYVIATATPFVVKALYKKKCKNTELFVTEDNVYGSYSSFVFKKTLQIPLDKVDNLTVINTFIDKLRTGKTLGICSSSGVIKLHFIQNAEDIVRVTMEKINQKHVSRKNEIVNTKTIGVDSLGASTIDKLKELANMKEAGLISEEEYDKKRADLIEKM